jgi:uncharacterized membrane protein YgdD (TMEM256/DUF423 family)
MRRAAILVIAAGLLGAAGVALAAAASHGGEPRLLASAAALSLAHAPALLGLASLSEKSRLLLPAGLLLALGTMLFAADLTLRATAGSALFPMSAPIGGFGMIAGWVVVAIAGLVMATRRG